MLPVYCVAKDMTREGVRCSTGAFAIMKALSQVSLKVRFAILVLIPLSAIAGLSVYALTVFSDINRGVSSIYNDRIVPMKDLKEISDDYAVFVVDAINKANAGVISSKEALKQLEEAETSIETSWQSFTSTKLKPSWSDLR